MICPYCSTDMEPVELNGKVFCSNCGLTIANNGTGETTSTPITEPTPDIVSNVATNAPEEVDFPVVPEVSEQTAPAPTKTAIEVPVEETPVSEPRKLEVLTDEPTPVEPSRPITEQAEKEMGLNPQEPALESKIGDLSIPSENDFDTEAPTPEVTTSSYVELANPGNEQSTLETSGILLDILSEEKPKKPPVNRPATEPLNPVLEPEITEETTTDEKDDVYTLPKEVKVGLRNKKLEKEPEVVIDVRTEKKIEKIEEEIAEAPEPVVELTAEETKEYDPDTFEPQVAEPSDEKSKIIKDYFSTAIERDKKAKKVKTKKAKRKNIRKVVGMITAILLGLGVVAASAYAAYIYFKPASKVTTASELNTFATLTPSYTPEGYTLTTSSYADAHMTSELDYVFASDSTKTITYRQIKTDTPDKYISDYLLQTSDTFTVKDVNGIVYTESAKANLLWQKDGFVFVIETKGYTLSVDLLYQMAESIQQ